MTSLLSTAGFRDTGAQLVEASWHFADRSEIADLFLDQLPHVRMMLGNMSEEEIEEVRALMVEETVRIAEENGMWDGKAGVLKGTAVVGWGRK